MPIGPPLPVVRVARPQDADLLPEVEHSAGESFRAIPDLAWIADDDVMPAAAHLPHVEAGTAWVAQGAGGAVIGFLTAERIGDELHVWELAVRHDLQGRGIGRRLLEAACAWARGAGLDAVTLTTFRDVAWNEAFYARLGFVTLDGDAVGPRLSATLRREVAHGLPDGRRCAMRLRLSP